MRLYLHVGGEKTGTTTIQEFCRANRASLNELGYLYPHSLGISNHLKLTAYALNDENFQDDTRKYFGIRTSWDLRNFRTAVEKDLAEEVSSAGGAVAAILSNELIQSRLTTVAELKQLLQLFKPIFSDISALMYLRRQDRVAVSHYSTRLKSDSDPGAPIFPDLSPGNGLPRYFDYDETLAQFECVFGKQNICVRLIEPGHLKGGDLLTDFREFCGIPETASLEMVERENESLSHGAIAFYNHINTSLPRFIFDAPNPLRAGLNIAMSKKFSGGGPEVARSDAWSFYEKFLPGNRNIHKRYFDSGDPDLFSKDFSMYMDRPSGKIDTDELLDIAEHLWLERTMEVERLRLENYLLRFSLAICKGAKRPAPPPPTLSVGPHTPGNPAAQWLGALLYIGENQRALESARILESANRLPIYTLGRFLAIMRLGNQGRLDDEMKQTPPGAKVAASVSLLKKFGVGGLNGVEMVNIFKQGDALCQQMYKRLFQWIELE